MLSEHKRTWFKVCAGITAGLTLWTTAEAAVHSDLARANRLRAERAEDVAKRLGLDPQRVRGGEAYEAQERSNAVERRQKALEALQQKTRVDSARVAEASRKRKEIEARHAPDLLAGLAQTAGHAGARLRGGAVGTDDAALIAAGAALRDAARLARSRGLKDAKVQQAVARAEGLGEALRPQPGQRRLGEGVRRSAAAQAPAPRGGPSLDGRRPGVEPDALPPAPRKAPRLGAAVPGETRALYAELLDAPGLEVETEFGVADPALLAAGIGPELRFASVGDLSSELLGLGLGALADPGPSDLQETGDARLTAEMRALVTSLNGDPLALYDFVHDQFQTEVYYGSKKGSAGAFEERAGNDADLASLLVALLRAANIPARYEYGTVDLTPEQAMAWSGTTDPSVAADALASGGIPATKILDGAKVAAVRVEHLWVRAFLPYSNYRGLPRPGSRPIWVRLDPTLKRASLRPGLDLRGKVTFDYGAFLSKVSGDTPLQRLEAQLRAWTLQNGVPCNTLDDAIPSSTIVPDQLSLLPAELPAPVVASLATFSGFPSSMRHTASVAVGGWAVSLDLPELYGKAITLRYRGATAADEQAIAAAGGVALLTTPSTVQLVPTLEVDGQARGRGEAVVPGLDQEWTIGATVPNGTSFLVRHRIAAGGVHALGFPVGRVPDALVARREADLAAAKAASLTGDDLEVAVGQRALWRYFWHVDREQERIFGLSWMRLGRGVSEAIAGRELEADLLYGTPVRVKAGKHVIDVARMSLRPYAVDGQNAGRKEIALLAGYQSSTREHLIWEETIHVPAISTVRILQVARSQGLTIRTFDQSNATGIASLPYSAAAIGDLSDKVHAGLVARVPERPVTWGVYQGAEGYVIEDPVTGSADFRLLGLYSGGAGDGEGAPPGVGCPVCGDPDVPASSSVSLALGNMHFSETDLSVPARGIPVAFTRHYDSMSPYGGRLGPGWLHAYEVRLVPSPDGSVLFVNDAFRAERFTPVLGGTYAVEPGYHEKLADTPGGGWLLTFKDGLQYRFRPDGQLETITDLNGHVVRCRYDGAGRLEAVVDATGVDALQYEYDGAAALAAVSDAAGRRVVFGHTGGDLTSVTDVLGHVEQFSYLGHRLASKTDRNGNTTQESYDGEGRWVGSLEADGHGRSVAYDMLNRRAVHVDKRGTATVWEYNARGNPTAVTDALGNQRSMEWDDKGNRTAEVDARGQRTVLAYDGEGNLLSRTDPLGATVSYTYNARGQVLTTTDAAMKVTLNEYDDRGNLKATTDPTGAVTSYGYSSDGLPETIAQPGGAITVLGYASNGQVSTVTDPEGGTTILGYDGFGHLHTITDALGGGRIMQADAAGRIGSMTDAAGATTTFEYDAQGNRMAVVDPSGTRTTFGYDASNRLTSVTDGAGHVTRTEYDPEGSVLARVDALGRRTEYRYDAIGRLAETSDPLGNVTTQGYCADVPGQACAVVDPLGQLTGVTFDALGRPTLTTDPLGRTSEQHYDASGRRDWSKDAAGRVTAYGFDALGRLAAVQDPLGGVTAYGYDERGNRTSVTDANGHVTAFAYDRANRLRSETNPLGLVTAYEYDAAGNRRFKTDGNGLRTEYQYDANRRLKKVLFADGTAYDFDYDALGNRTLERSPHHERGLHYDALGRLDRVEDRTLGRTITYSYDALGHRELMTVDTGETVHYRWDAAGRLAETTDPEGETTRFFYDAAGRRSTATYGNGTSASWAHDAAGQVLSIVYADRAGDVLTAFAYAYDASGNRSFKAFADGTKEAYGYDALNRLTAVDYPGGRHVEYQYDGVGNRLLLTDSAKAQTRWGTSATASSQNGFGPASGALAPDATAWMPLRTDASPQWVEVTYAKAERVKGLRIHELNQAPFVARVDLIEEGGASHTVFDGGDQTAVGGWLSLSLGATPYAVKKARVWTVSRPPAYNPTPEQIDAVGLDALGVDSYQYNDFNQLTSVSGSDGTVTAFDYDGNGNQVHKVERPSGSPATTWTYAYDLDNRLVNVSHHAEVPAPTQWATGATASTSLYPGGEAGAEGAPDTSVCGITSTAWAPMPMPWSSGEWLQAQFSTATPAKGVRIHETFGAPFVKQVDLVEPGGAAHTVWKGQDATACGGFLTVGFEGTTYPVAGVKVTTVPTWNLGLDAVGLDPVPAQGPEVQVAAYEYDANGLRVRKSDSAGERSFLLDGLSIVAEYTAPGAREAWYTQSLARIDEPLNVVNGSGKFWYQADALGSIYTLATSSGGIQARGGYDVFGEPVAMGGAAVGQPFGFTGREHELGSGLVYARDRFLASEDGRWTQQDRARGVDGPNPFAYVSGSPTNFTDPLGLFLMDLASLFGRDAILAEQALAAAEDRPIDYGTEPIQWDGLSAVEVAIAVSSFAAGLGDTLLPWVGKRLRQLTGGDDCVDYDSAAYSAGVIAGTLIWTLLFGAVTVETQVAARFNLVKGENWLTTNWFRWGKQAFKGSNGPVWHFHLGPGNLINHHLPQQWQTWAYHLLSMVRRLF
jgi:RHS repeat-associated protein